jgi:hypothetical protein
MDPAVCGSFDEAKAFIIDAMEREADHQDDYARIIEKDDPEGCATAHDEAEELSAECEDLNLTSAGDWGTTVGNCAYWITYDPEADPEEEMI